MLDLKFFKIRNSAIAPFVVSRIDQTDAFLRNRTNYPPFTFKLALAKFEKHTNNHSALLLFYAIQCFNPQFIQSSMNYHNLNNYNLITEFQNPSNKIINEWVIYCGLSEVFEEGSLDLNQYWQEKKEKFPNLSKIAFIYIWLPISDVDVERSFLNYKRILEDQCRALSKNSIEIVINGNDQDLKLSLNTGDNIFALSSIEDNLSCDTKIITCTDSENVPSDKMSGLIATQLLDKNQVTEQTLKYELSRFISSVASVKLHNESILNNTIESFTQKLVYWIDEAMRMKKGIGIDRIKLVTCSTSDISRLNITQIQNIIDYVNDQIHIASKTVTIGNNLNYVTSKEMISSQASRTNPTYD
ncbi:hypothetical protein GLOIN_2v1761741 [Rhizophagus clarus]|uniref:HAT C-terminal dimerisation domain-containing protein n=1 Tax=Rhizophagus clarus TaxID=94130 RepID=A0A8H3R467_9GLOM|nr:hypothetical protein GLOIN_2v1761741 [Rhizophagus clarus]